MALASTNNTINSFPNFIKKRFMLQMKAMERKS